LAAEIFHRKGQTPEETEAERLYIALGRSPAEQLMFLFELIGLSRLLQPNKTDAKEMSLFQEEVVHFFSSLARQGVDYIYSRGRIHSQRPWFFPGYR